jgi:hypothetical protein
VSLTPVANGKIRIRKIFIIYFGHLLSCQQFDNCSHCLPPVSTTLVKLVEKFAAGVVDTGVKFAPGDVDTGGNLHRCC